MSKVGMHLVDLAADANGQPCAPSWQALHVDIAAAEGALASLARKIAAAGPNLGAEADNLAVALSMLDQSLADAVRALHSHAPELTD